MPSTVLLRFSLAKNANKEADVKALLTRRRSYPKQRQDQEAGAVALPMPSGANKTSTCPAPVRAWRHITVATTMWPFLVLQPMWCQTPLALPLTTTATAATTGATGNASWTMMNASGTNPLEVHGHDTTNTQGCLFT